MSHRQMPVGEKIQYKPDSAVQVKCPCGQTVVAGEHVDGTMSVIHKEPLCERFVSLEPEDFLTYIRQFYSRLTN